MRSFSLRICALAVLMSCAAEAASASWPQWRGPLATGEAPQANPPLTWSETNNIRWKVAVPGSGTSTPIVWENRVLLLTAIPSPKPAPSETAASETKPAKKPDVHKFDVLCFDRASGKLLWQKTVREEVPHEGHHNDHGFASASPVTDGQVLVAFFGSRGLHGLDLNGNLKWSKDLGRMQTRNSFGEGASPALSGNIVVVNWDDETENDFIAAFDKNSGKELWRKPRNEATGWSTPLVIEFQGKRQVVVNASGKVRSYELETGNEIWQCAGQTANAIPTPVASGDTVYVTSGFRGNAVYAIALDRTGDLTGTDAIRWTRSKHTPYVPSPLLVGNLLYLVTANNGVLTCLDTATGSPHFEGERLEGITGIYASPVAAKGSVYVLGRNGVCLVLKQGPKPEILARNTIGEKTDASLALVDNQIFLRSHKHLFCIQNPEK